MQLDVYGDTLCALVTATALAANGNDVVLHVPDAAMLAELQRQQCPFRGEPDLADMLAEQIEERRLTFTTVSQPPAMDSATVFIAVAPSALRLVEEIVAGLAELRPRHWLLINQTTFPVHTTSKLQAVFAEQAKDIEGATLSAVSLPDVLQEGAAVKNFTRPDNIILGCDDERAERRMRELLRPFNRRRDGILVMRPEEAEFTKLAVTGMLATRLSFMNEMANLADVFAVDIEMVRQGVGADPRIGSAYLYPGCGFGGSNFSRDVKGLADTLARNGIDSELMRQVLLINEQQKELLFRKLWQHYHCDLRGKTVAIWGAAFKPNTPRIDHAPSLKLIDALLAQGVKIQLHDPQAIPLLSRHFAGVEGIQFFDDEYLALQDADALMLVTEWKCYWQPNFVRMKELMRQPLVLDGRNVYGPAVVRGYGFDYYGVGRR